ncbi:hypothetical protein [Flavobacterium flavigenum]|uniref:hypothetical protein n=1 Tax=Flavobacterium flavigenum TaxID=3003258 RepID=UPI0022ABF44B|nr:hypothetical protein [Flavobacterium flavigenum]
MAKQKKDIHGNIFIVDHYDQVVSTQKEDIFGPILIERGYQRTIIIEDWGYYGKMKVFIAR